LPSIPNHQAAEAQKNRRNEKQGIRMKVGLLMVFQNFEDGISDTESWVRDIHLAGLAEPLGFDVLSAVEHHFYNYAMSPDNTQFLSHMAAKTQQIKLLTGAVILPWHNPLRVVERMIVLDHLSQGRALFGIGRGLARREYDTFGVDMNEARDRFDEAAELIIEALESGIFEGRGKHYGHQPRTQIRPGPYASFKDRFYAVGMSSDSVPIVARLGAKMMSFAQKPWAEMGPHFDTFRTLYQQHHGSRAPSPVCVDFLSCDESAEKAEADAREYMANYYITVMEHYEMTGDHFKQMKGYGDYASNAELLKEAGMDEAANGFVDINTWGTPVQILDKLDQRRTQIGDFDLTVQVSYGGLSGADAEKNMRLFCKEVLPELRSWQTY
jgi:alkanesulfonate monooxygenase SsuD/methylene tetrahydromethanopterin reductase-like flavin-dependent oxidoreductase (luciferase family)